MYPNRPGGSEGRNFGQVASDVYLAACNHLVFLLVLMRTPPATLQYRLMGWQGHAGGGAPLSQSRLRGLREWQAGVHVQRKGAVGIYMRPQ
jgi:hypothetical protein